MSDPGRLYQAIQTLRDKQPPPSADEIQDAAVWATEALGRDYLATVRGASPADALDRLRTACLDAHTVTVEKLKAKGVTELLGSQRGRDAMVLKIEDSTIGVKQAEALAATPFTRLVALGLRRNRLKAPHLEVLCTSKQLATIETLELGGNAFGPAGANLLAASTAFPALRSLEVRFTRLGLAGVTALANGPALRRLRALEIGTDRLGPSVGAVLASGSSLANLRSLTVFKQNIGNEGLEALVEAPIFTQLRSLDLMENRIGNAGIEALARSAAMSRLEQLQFRYDPISDPALAALARSPHMANLKRLQISQCRLGADGLRALARSEHIRLERLDIGTNPGIGNGVTHLATEPFSGLRELALDGLYLGDEGLGFLATVTSWPRLESLALTQNQITDSGIATLVKWPALRQLKHLELGTNDVTDSGLERLVHTPGLQLETIELWQSPCADNARAILDASPLRAARLHTEMFQREWPTLD